MYAKTSHYLLTNIIYTKIYHPINGVDNHIYFFSAAKIKDKSIFTSVKSKCILFIIFMRLS